MRKELNDAFYFRYACKKFDKTKIIPKDDFELILKAARLSPSSFGIEPWKFLVVQKESLRESLKINALGAIACLEGASHFVIILARKQIDTIFDAEYITYIMKDIQKLSDNIIKIEREIFENFQKNDFELLDSERATYDWASKQTYIALANMLSTAALLKIDSCAVEGFNIEGVEQLLEKEGLLDRKHFGVSLMAGFGYRAEAVNQIKTRQEAKDVIEWVK